MPRLPIYPLDTQERDGAIFVRDPLRKRYILLTPEEHVRQCLTLFMLRALKVPQGLLSIERGLVYNDRQKRYDLLVFGRDGSPFLLCECKSPRVKMDKSTLFQLITYNAKIGARRLLMTNGTEMRFFMLDRRGKFAPARLADDFSDFEDALTTDFGEFDTRGMVE